MFPPYIKGYADLHAPGPPSESSWSCWSVEQVNWGLFPIIINYGNDGEDSAIIAQVNTILHR